MGQPTHHSARHRHRLLIGLLIGTTGCGRISFEAGPDAGADSGASCTNPIGHDEDGDGIDDRCDLCPVTPSSNNADSDGDGVGDVCDPEPAIARQRLVAFEPFLAPGASWGTDQSFVPDAVRLPGNLWFDANLNEVDVEVRGVIRTVATTGVNQILVAIERGPITWYAEVFEVIGVERRMTVQYFAGVYDAKANLDLADPFPTGPLAFRISVRPAAGVLASRIDIGATNHTLSGTYTEDISNGDRFHIYAEGFDLDITAVLLVESI